MRLCVCLDFSEKNFNSSFVKRLLMIYGSMILPTRSPKAIVEFCFSNFSVDIERLIAAIH